MKAADMKRKRNVWNRFLYFLAITGVLFILPGVLSMEKASAASVLTQGITENANPEDETEWKVLWIIARTATGTNKSGQPVTATAVSNEQIEKLRYVVENFDAYIYDYSMHYMKTVSTIIVIDQVEAKADGAYASYYASLVYSEQVDAALKASENQKQKLSVVNNKVVLTTIEEPIDPREYDQVTVIWQSQFYDDQGKQIENKSIHAMNYQGLGGMTYLDSMTGFDEMVLDSPNLDLYLRENVNKEIEGYRSPVRDENGKLCYNICDAYVHEFIHCLEFRVKFYYPYVLQREMPSADGYGIYYDTSTHTEGVMEEFYKYFFRGQVPTSKGSTETFGMTIEDYKRKPTAYKGREIGNRTVASLEEWNEITADIWFGVETKNCKITFTENIDAEGKPFGQIWRAFEGEIDGAGHAIIGAKLATTGLMWELADGASIKNLTMINATLDYTAQDMVRCGILTGMNYGKISNCAVTGRVSAVEMVGGIAGTNEESGVIENCFSGVSVKGRKGDVGGITGYNIGIVKNCYAYGKVGTRNVSMAESTGVLVGHNGKEENIVNSYGLAGQCGEDGPATGILTDEEMKDAEFVTMLNQDGDNWSKGEEYPQLKNAQYLLSEYPALPELAEGEIIWANGYKENRAITLTTTLTATEFKDARGKTKKGKLVWLVKEQPTEITFSDKHIVQTKKDSNLATISTKGVVKAKAAGTVYVYAIDTGSLKSEEFIVTIMNSPTKLTMTSVAGSMVKTELVKNVNLQIGETSGKIYINNFLKKAIVSMEDLEYTLTTDKNCNGAVTVSEVQKDSNGYYFTTTAVKNNVAGKSTKCKITVLNTQSNKKATVSVTVVNSVTKATGTGGDEIAKKQDKLTINPKLQTHLIDAVTTDAIKVYVCNTAPTAAGVKITAAASKEIGVTYKNNVILLTAKKDVTTECGIYLACTDKVNKKVAIYKIGTISAEGKVTYESE